MGIGVSWKKLSTNLLRKLEGLGYVRGPWTGIDRASSMSGHTVYLMYK